MHLAYFLLDSTVSEHHFKTLPEAVVLGWTCVIFFTILPEDSSVVIPPLVFSTVFGARVVIPFKPEVVVSGAADITAVRRLDPVVLTTLG